MIIIHNIITVIYVRYFSITSFYFKPISFEYKAMIRIFSYELNVIFVLVLTPKQQHHNILFKQKHQYNGIKKWAHRLSVDRISYCFS